VAAEPANEFDVICIGAGTVSEAVAKELEGTGISLAVVERELVGGECPYWGCIPSKTLLRSAEVLAEAERARALAASRVEFDVDFAKIAERTHKIAGNEDDTAATKSLVREGATVIRGDGRLTGPHTVMVGDRELSARKGIVIGTGTSAAIPPISGLDRVDYWTNRQATLTRELPASLLVLGSGPIGAELAQAFARFGSRVHVVEALDRLIPGEEPEAGAELAKAFETDGIAVSLSAKAVGAEQSADGISLRLEGGASLTAERLLVCIGRRPKLAGIDLAASGISTTEKGWVKVDDATLVAAPGIWAGGDVTGIGAFTHLSWYHGLIIGRQLKGDNARADHRAIPRVTFTDPEIASVGLSEAHARRQLGNVRVVSADSGNGTRGYINGPPGGVIKLIADMDRKVLVGALVVGPRAGEMIAELTLAIRAEISLTVLEDTLHAFPTFSRDLDGLFPKLVDR
jgi:pyruvate/2-oxoglutarate dehydrogenase complex dihydrolipoamide dehydrogenase (E3) component